MAKYIIYLSHDKNYVMYFGHFKLLPQILIGLVIAHWVGWFVLRARHSFTDRMLVYLIDFVIAPIYPLHFCSYLLVIICTHISKDPPQYSWVDKHSRHSKSQKCKEPLSRSTIWVQGPVLRSRLFLLSMSRNLNIGVA